MANPTIDELLDNEWYREPTEYDYYDDEEEDSFLDNLDNESDDFDE